jgi:chromosome segregation ATPase
MMTKIQSIQKRLIAKTEEVRIKEGQLEQREQELKSLQEVLKRQPSVEEERMIPVYEDTLDQKQRQVQSMRDEIENYDETILEYKIEYERLQKELQTYKQKFFTQKKREQQAKEDKKAQEDYIKVILPDKRFTGGGFNLAI